MQTLYMKQDDALCNYYCENIDCALIQLLHKHCYIVILLTITCIYVFCYRKYMYIYIYDDYRHCYKSS